MNFAILGAGAWGTAVAVHLARLGHRVTLAPRRIEHALEIASARENKDYLPGFPLDQNIQIGCELLPVLMEADVAILACPSNGLRDLCQRISTTLDDVWNLEMVITLCKGLERDTLLKPAQVVAEVLPDITCGVLSGPTNAAEVAAGKPTAIVLASEAEEALSREIQHAINGPALRVYRSGDVSGVELGGCLKNIYAIGAGICDGLGLGDNARAAFLTRALHEMVRLGSALGGRSETFYGLSGFGDMVATCTGSWSRNRSFGEAFSSGQSIESLLSERKTVVEGYAATDCFHRIVSQSGKEAPLLNEIHAMLYSGKDPKVAIGDLMNRELKTEH
ncbi:NAD(P)H-dependent glycerol-3-phosphate dehydrogenase [Rubellicoccus peritrichatus]|uniref:Glycerol-3-phosphate dehydrogenase [NAD(P)+] n=1 Tax=Rubellicoccus peritrichatus TaxID=3080537 RepID=A0AAQ3QXW3_9BACT|nr:NAD(P)H-dependent glycerol-3-phosphate dehydrogenase [Puniceicoccus sp. CR14]WOO43472.1 NAD(P)H-dependent glycerol-3-phosphate dehydrogenase [Puniceicoccus sp. CR14]